jgi:uncharacterized protein YkwD
MDRLHRTVRPSAPSPRLSSGLAIGLAACLALLAACSDGSTGSPTDPATRSIAEVESASLQLVNDARGNAGADPVGFDATLAATARAHSEAMRDQGFFGHRDPMGQTFTDRLRQSGITFRRAGENLARVENSSDPAAFAHQRFLGNPPHRDNMLDTRYTDLGVGVAREGDVWWITQLYVER